MSLRARSTRKSSALRPGLARVQDLHPRRVTRHGRRQQPDPERRVVVRIAHLADLVVDIDPVDEVVVAVRHPADVDVLTLLQRRVDVAVADLDSLEDALGAPVVPFAVRHADRARADRPERDLVGPPVARQTEAVLVVADESLPIERPELVDLERLQMPVLVARIHVVVKPPDADDTDRAATSAPDVLLGA